MVLAQKQTHRSLEQNRELRNGPSTLLSTNIQQSRRDNPLEKDSLFNKWCRDNWTATCRIMKLDHSLTPYTRINSNWMKDLNVRQESIKILEESVSSNLFDLSCSNFLLDMSPKARETKAKMNYWDSNKIKCFCTAKEIVNKAKGTYKM